MVQRLPTSSDYPSSTVLLLCCWPPPFVPLSSTALSPLFLLSFLSWDPLLGVPPPPLFPYLLRRTTLYWRVAKKALSLSLSLSGPPFSRNQAVTRGESCSRDRVATDGKGVRDRVATDRKGVRARVATSQKKTCEIELPQIRKVWRGVKLERREEEEKFVPILRAAPSCRIKKFLT